VQELRPAASYVDGLSSCCMEDSGVGRGEQERLLYWEGNIGDFLVQSFCRASVCLAMMVSIPSADASRSESRSLREKTPCSPVP
jgi:hypothetical protein